MSSNSSTAKKKKSHIKESYFGGMKFGSDTYGEQGLGVHAYSTWEAEVGNHLSPV
jgi:hypothetical protein